MALSIGFRILSFLPSCYSSYRAWTFTPVGLSPTVHASLRWTHTYRYQSAPRRVHLRFRVQREQILSRVASKIILMTSWDRLTGSISEALQSACYAVSSASDR